MGSFSVSTSRGLVYWKGLLLAVSLLTFWCHFSSAQFSNVSKTVATRQYVRLRLQQTPLNVQGYQWFRGESEKPNCRIGSYFIRRRLEIRPIHKKRVLVDIDGSLVIKNASLSDSGMYTVVVYLPNKTKEIGWVQLNVYEPVRRPTLLASHLTATENEDAVNFTCNTSMAFPEWLFYDKNLQISERMNLSQDHRILTIDPIKREDAGAYKCRVSNPISSAESWVIWLYVKHE